MDGLNFRTSVTAATVEQLTPDESARKGRPGLSCGGALPRLSLLYSYYYLRNDKSAAADTELLVALAPYIDILIDSGAFTDFHMERKAAARGTSHLPLRLDDYIAWLHDTKEHWWQYVMLDVIRDPRASRLNLQRMVSKGLRPMPVFTYPETLDVVPELVGINEHLCVSGGTDAARSFMHQRIHRVYDASERRAKIHGLAFVKYPDIYQLPLYSVDSSTWLAGKRFGTIHRYEPRHGMVGGPWQKTLAAKRDPSTILHLRRCNISPDVLRTRAKPHWDTNDGIAASTTTNAHLQFFRHAYSLGRHYFLACACSYQILEIVSIVASQHETGGTFDYVKALNLAHHLKRCWKSKAKREAIETCVQLVRDTTHWTQGKRA